MKVKCRGQILAIFSLLRRYKLNLHMSVQRSEVGRPRYDGLPQQKMFEHDIGVRFKIIQLHTSLHFERIFQSTFTLLDPNLT